MMLRSPNTHHGRGTPVTPTPSANTVLIGDSLTALSYGELHPFTWQNRSGALRVVENIGVASETVANVLSRIDNLYTDASPGLAGLGTIGWAVLRIGTNDTRGGSSITGTVQTAYTNLFNKILTYADHLFVMAVPPVSSPGSGAGVNSYNAWLQSACAANPRLHWIDDTVTVNNGSGAWASGYVPADGVHCTPKGIARMSLDGASAMAAAIATYGYPNPLITDAADVYPTTTQRITNALMSGTSGTNSIGSGQVPTGWSVSSYGSGFAATTSIVAADVGDPNTANWLRVTPSQVTTGSGEYLLVSGVSSGGTITNSSPDPFEAVMQVRFNAFDSTRFSSLSSYLYGVSNEELTARLKLYLGDDSALSDTVIARSAARRSGTKLAHASATFRIQLSPNQSFTGSMGSFDLRCISVRT